MGIFLRFILPSLSRRCLAHLIGTHSPMLHFCREPNFASSRREPLCSCRINIVPLGEPRLVWRPYDATNIALKRRFIATNSTIYPCRDSLGLTHLWLRDCQLTLPRGGIEPPTCGVWARCSTDWTILAYVISAFCVDSSHTKWISLTLVQAFGAIN